MKMTMRTISFSLLGFMVLLIIFLSVQASAKNRSNPPVLGEPQWNSLETRALAERACFDCHSNETKWPLYSGLPLVGGLIKQHILDARQELNFSEWNTGRKQEDGEEAAEKVFEPMHYAEEDPFPQPPYSLFHPKARLSQAEKEQLASGLMASLGAEKHEDDDD